MDVKRLFFLAVFPCLVLSCKTNNNIADSAIKKEVNYIPYYLKVYEADSLFITKNYQKSYYILDSLFKIFQPINSYRLREYGTYCRLKIILNKKLIKKDFLKLISKYGYNEDWIKSDTILNFYFSKYKNRNVLYESEREKYIKNVNLKLRENIIELVKEDQKYRSEKKTINTQEMRRITDSINEIEIIKIFNDYGYPDRNMIGNYTIDKADVNIDVILYHTSTSKNNAYFFKKVLEYVREGKAEPDVYAFMIDRYNLFRYNKQIYGTFKSDLKESIHQVNQNRNKIGLPSLDYEDWKIKVLYPELN